MSGLNTETTTLQVSGTDLGGAGYNGNNSTICSSNVVLPDANGEILLTISKKSGSVVHLNAMKIEEFFTVPVVDVSGIDVTGSTSNGGNTYQMVANVIPVNSAFKNVFWSVDNPKIATIDDNGLLTAKQNGSVTVIAKTKQPNSTVSGTKKVDVSIIDVSEISVSGSLVNGGSIYQMTAGVLPANATYKDVFWSVDNPKIATINSSGLLVLNSIGTVKVTATTKQLNSVVNGSTQIVSTIDDSKLDKLKITVMGSSVASGSAATSSQGYAYLYGKLLAQRNTSGTGSNWTVSNISIGGSTTVSLLNRWESDLIPQFSKYVIYGLSLGNEGIAAGGQTTFEQYKSNMLLLIDKARAKGMIPVVMNCYARADYNAVDYAYIKQMNLLMQKWDVPTVNLLGAIDDGSGHWAIGYMNDALHPNNAGHIEFTYAMVPSLFDALSAGKPVPYKVSGTYITSEKSINSNQIEFTPDNIIHPFTLSFDVKTGDVGTIASFTQGTSSGTISINSSGAICYHSPTGTGIVGRIMNDYMWHKITLTHFYARGETILYVDNEEAGRINEKLEAKVFYLNDENSPNSIKYRDLFFYRSGLNPNEIAALNNGDMLKSSLEIYAPLDGLSIIGSDPYVNLAQSTNTLKINKLTTENKRNPDLSGYKIYPCPVKNILNINGLKHGRQYEYTIYNLAGRVVMKNIVENDKGLNVSLLPAAQYLLSLKDMNNLLQSTFSFTKN